MTTLREPVEDAAGPRRQDPGPWSAPRAEGPLAQALKLAAAQRSQATPQGPASPASPDRPLDADIEALAREASARDAAREAMALALEWPEESDRPARARARIGRLALAAALALAFAAAAIAIAWQSDEPPPAPRDGLKLERHLSVPPQARPRG